MKDEAPKPNQEFEFRIEKDNFYAELTVYAPSLEEAFYKLECAMQNESPEWQPKHVFTRKDITIFQKGWQTVNV